MVILKLNKFYHQKSPFLLKDVDIEKVLVSNKISFGGKNYKHFICYLCNDHKDQPLRIMLSKTSANVKSMMDELNGCMFWLKMMTY